MRGLTPPPTQYTVPTPLRWQRVWRGRWPVAEEPGRATNSTRDTRPDTLGPLEYWAVPQLLYRGDRPRTLRNPSARLPSRHVTPTRTECCTYSCTTTTVTCKADVIDKTQSSWAQLFHPKVYQSRTSFVQVLQCKTLDLRASGEF